MKTNQAKAVAGIKYKVTTREEHARAEDDCVRQIITARREGNDARAAELSEAKTFFQERARARNTCAACGVTISRGATHCRIHQRSRSARALPSPVGNQPKTKKRLNPRKPRVWMDPLTPLGYYATPVQKVVRRWRPEIGEEIFDADTIHSLMITCVCLVQRHDSTKPFFYHKRFALEIALAVENVRKAWRGKIHDKLLGIMLESYTTPLLSSITDLDSRLDPIFKNHRLFILELLLAVDKVNNDPAGPWHWILKYCDCGIVVNGEPLLSPWPEISKESKFTQGQLKQAAKRMKLTA
jgi:hypothetical protein